VNIISKLKDNFSIDFFLFSNRFRDSIIRFRRVLQKTKTCMKKTTFVSDGKILCHITKSNESRSGERTVCLIYFHQATGLDRHWISTYWIILLRNTHDFGQIQIPEIQQTANKCFCNLQNICVHLTWYARQG
jgi:hypothetical protein